ncbi:Fe-S cluster assembly scaffold IscU [Chitinophaga oryziterrae]|uniref:Fe-S cluster assembly scaffold IscU n=1 Tax=Chitinophaga oryziterrae TaxID=1031224 RepID=A0A6N8JKR5_9BACT|nr:iron-sulfur cluster assembly scaffold protein [Chitinophaga oryziterrae]MVT44989.1 Fe-S cluster assembly scaffold IscU [Chitinophaga oryziterrae]
MSYSEKILDYYNNPRNAGSLDKTNACVGTGLVHVPEYIEVIRLQIQVNPATSVITDAKFKTFGSGAAIAVSSLATEWLKWKTLDEAAQIDDMYLVEELDLPPAKIHCATLVEEAIKAAINDYRTKNGLEELKFEEVETGFEA